MSEELPAELPAPIPLALIVCDAIWQDPSTGKPTLLGIFSELGAGSFPAVHPLLAVYASLTDAQGQVPVNIRLVDVDEEQEPLFEFKTDVEFPDRRAIIDLTVHMKGVAFPGPGEYRLQLFARNEFLLERRLLMRKV